MASVSHRLPFSTHFSGSKSGQESNKQKLYCVKINGSNSFAPAKVDLLSQDHETAVTSVDASASVHMFEQQVRQNIPTKKQLVDPYRQGVIVEEGVGYRQTVVIRSYEVGPDKTATIESILNLLQETALNHVWMSGLLGDGFGATHGMMRNNLIWVVSRMQVQVDHYPIWGEVMEIDTWVGASGKNGMRRDWLLRSQATGLVFARATSTWVMMNQQTRRLSKMPDEPKRSDLDMNHHVNNVKYVRWMLESIPDEFLENHQLADLILEYRRECGIADVVQSLCEPQEDGLIKTGIQQCNHIGLNGHSSLSSEILGGNGLLGSLDQGPLSYTHLLQVKGEPKNEEIVRGKTTWKPKLNAIPFPP
ncbi:palmitoyl-acyl carrier protein thioesterase, chloroplastic-like isoform X2 [Sesamum indicum]|uniref:Acyl-[acyl-carrier-protein] hydrolase n=1 Tax=Sesamum indicum TaxID=4182 RepID=A0A8M8V7V8_SESIN|nr:palmitoyl-acyl carrier protein thioesterase, chloroplastic-like isoform X2 [Sesamum indicum]